MGKSYNWQPDSVADWPGNQTMNIKIPPPIYVVLFGVLMWFVARSPFALAVDIPFRKTAAAIIFAAAIAIDVTAIRQFNASSTTINPLKPNKSSALVTQGIYRFTRNPMYVGLLLMLCAWAIVLGSVSNVLLLAGFVITITRMQIRPEEEALRSLFPEEFDEYRRKVRRWV